MRRIAGPSLLLALIGCNAILGLDARTLSEDASPSDATTGDQGSDAPSDSGFPGAGDDGAGRHADAGRDAGVVDAAPAPVHGKVILVNAAGLGPALRFCYGSVNADGGDGGAVTILQEFPFPNAAPGVPLGTGGPVADRPVDLSGLTLEIYAISATSAASVLPADGGPELTCDELVGDKALAADGGGLGLTKGVDYWDLGTLPSGTLADGTTTLLVVNGCAPGLTDSNDQDIECPSGYDPTKGNLGMWTAKLDNTTALDGGAIGAQFAYASYPFSFLSHALADGVATVAGFFVATTFVPDAGTPADAGDAAVEAAAPVTVNVPYPIAQGVTNGQLAPMTLAPVSGVTFDGTSGFFANVVTLDGGATPYNVALPLPNIQQISAPSADGGYFANGAGYVFVLVGDPGQSQLTDAGQFNVLSPHILGFPTNPPFPN